MRTAAEKRWSEQAREQFPEQTGVTRCAVCKWAFVGSLAQGAVAHGEHRAEAHPERATTAKKRKRDPRAAPCPFCGRMFVSGLTAHVRSCLASGTCPRCGVVIPNVGNLASHARGCGRVRPSRAHHTTLSSDVIHRVEEALVERPRTAAELAELIGVADHRKFAMALAWASGQNRTVARRVGGGVATRLLWHVPGVSPEPVPEYLPRLRVALRDGPLTVGEVAAALGLGAAREVSPKLTRARELGYVVRFDDGRWALVSGAAGVG